MADPSLPRACGACSLCCKLLPIAALEKPHEKWCAHCRPGAGCTIYESRPETCRSFACHWLADPAAGEYWAPLKSRMVVQITGGHDATYQRFVDVHIDRTVTDAWRQEPYAADLRRHERRSAHAGAYFPRPPQLHRPAGRGAGNDARMIRLEPARARANACAKRKRQAARRGGRSAMSRRRTG